MPKPKEQKRLEAIKRLERNHADDADVSEDETLEQVIARRKAELARLSEVFNEYR